jgi:preprotein translocase subunit YajC
MKQAPPATEPPRTQGTPACKNGHAPPRLFPLAGPPEGSIIHVLFGTGPAIARAGRGAFCGVSMGSILSLVLLAAEGEGGSGSSGGGGEWWSMLILMGMIFAIFFFLVIRPQMRKEKERQEMLKNIKKNDKVVTAGGMLGTVVSVKDRWVVLKIDENKDIRAKVLLGSVTDIVSEEGKPEDEKEAADSKAEK